MGNGLDRDRQLVARWRPLAGARRIAKWRMLFAEIRACDQQIWTAGVWISSALGVQAPSGWLARMHDVQYRRGWWKEPRNSVMGR